MVKLTRIFSFHPTQIFLGKCPGPDRSSALTPQVPTGCQTALLPPPAMSGEDAKYSNPTQKGETASRDLASCAPSPGYAPSRAGCPHSPPPNLLPGPPAPHAKRRGTAGDTGENERAHPTRGAPGARNRCPPVTRASNAALCPAPRPQTHAAAARGRAFHTEKLPSWGKPCRSGAAGGKRESCGGTGPSPAAGVQPAATSVPSAPVRAPPPPATFSLIFDSSKISLLEPRMC